MATTAIISSERLDLIPLTPAFLQASLNGEYATAESLLGLAIPPEWFQEQALVKIRLAQLQQNSALQPWLLRAIGLCRQRLMVGHIGFHTQPERNPCATSRPVGSNMGIPL
jgi:ribosomal-protein-alanine N-acetyltransferase